MGHNNSIDNRADYITSCINDDTITDSSIYMYGKGSPILAADVEDALHL